LASHIRKEHGLRVFKNRVLRKMLAPAWEEVTGDWRKLRKEECATFCTAQQMLLE
jgi:hypothetical protein